jgi:parallel beta-helix repeat protein
VRRWLTAVVLASALAWSGCATGITGSPSNVTGSFGDVRGAVATNSGGEVEYWAEYGPTTAYGSETAHLTTTVPDDSGRSVGVRLPNLELATTYHYRVCAQDSEQTGGPGCGSDATLTTPSVDCGGTVTTDVRLTAPMDCQGGPGNGGWTIGADGVDVNLGGNTFTGFSPVGTAIANTGHDDVTIRNGTIVGWSTTISLADANRNSIRDIDGFRVSISGGEDNEFRRPAARLSASGSNGLTVADSQLQAGFGSQSAPALSFTGDGARILRNVITGGVLEPGILIFGSGNRVVGNEVTGASHGGIVIRAGSDNRVRDNRVHDSQSESSEDAEVGDGIFVGPFTTAIVVRGNTVSANRGDGIEVQGAGTRIGDNSATGNGDFGIDAVSGVTDIGGNTASGNGNPLQCRNVFCAAP